MRESQQEAFVVLGISARLAAAIHHSCLACAGLLGRLAGPFPINDYARREAKIGLYLPMRGFGRNDESGLPAEDGIAWVEIGGPFM